MRNPLSDFTNSVRAGALGVVNPKSLDDYVAKVDAQVAESGKAEQKQVLYTPVPVAPPLAWDYRCGECRMFEEPNGCKWVDGEINQDGWCTLWVAPEGVRPFSWLTNIGAGPKVVTRVFQRLFKRE